MFSFQSHNQVLYHLTQLTSAKSTSFPVKIKRKNEFTKIVDDISSNTFLETKKSYTEMFTSKLSAQDLNTRLDIKKNNVWLILDELAMKVSKKHLEETTKWKVSYVSGSSFAENKQRFPCAQLTEPIIRPALLILTKQNNRTLCTLCAKPLFPYHMQLRNFKTKQSMKAESERLSVMRKFKNWVGISSDLDKSATDAWKKSHLGRIRFSIVNDEVLSKEVIEEQTKMREAYIAGYEMGVNRHRIMEVSGKHISNLLLICLIGVAVLAAVRVLRVGQSSEVNPETINVTFKDVKGVDEATQELRDVVEFLKNPEKYAALGGKLPKGVLLVGPPGTGKTLLARAVAGEAGVPFFHAAGPEFDEILVGQGARRVRELFKAAKQKAPSVIFIDEIDSVGAKRTPSVIHPYANQTINQLLAEMDGFLPSDDVIVLGATNRRDDLDGALMRPGRFDVEIFVHTPDLIGRKEILVMYLSRVSNRDIDLDYLARCTAGFTGADIENLVNQAALRAATNNADFVTMQHFEYAKDKIQMGPERKLRALDEEQKLITAYHEAGHTLVAYFTKDAMPLNKVTIIPRGPSLGHTSFLPEKDLYLATKSQLLGQMDGLMGGRAAEELIFGSDKITTGAASDFKQATQIAEQMVKDYGMSEKVGFRTYGGINKKGVLQEAADYGPTTNELIDNEVKRLLQESYERAKMILKNHGKEHKLLAEALLKYETLDADDVKSIVNENNTRVEGLNNQPSIVDPSKHVL